MILHRLGYRYLRHGDDRGFYQLQAQETVRWLESVGMVFGQGMSVLDLGCGHGMIGKGLEDKGCKVLFVDEADCLLPDYEGVEFRLFDIEKSELASLGKYDLVVCSNVLEHLPRPERLLGSISTLLEPGGMFYLSWTNGLSPWWGHEFAPLHYLGAMRGARLYDRFARRQRIHTPFVNLFPCGIGRTLQEIARDPELNILFVVPRYYPELAFLTRIPFLREFLTFNCAILIQRTGQPELTASGPGAA